MVNGIFAVMAKREKMTKQMEKWLTLKHPDGRAYYFKPTLSKLLPSCTCNPICPPVQESSVLSFHPSPDLWSGSRHTLLLNLMILCSCSLQPQRLIWTCALNNLALTGRSWQVVLVCLFYARGACCCAGLESVLFFGHPGAPRSPALLTCYRLSFITWEVCVCGTHPILFLFQKDKKQIHVCQF